MFLYVATMDSRCQRLSPEAFAALVDQAIARIPAEIHAHLDNIIITVQRRPSPEILADLGYAADEPLFGLYTGTPLTDRSVTEPQLYPDSIVIYQEPLAEACSSLEELIEEIEITVVHEVAHLIGFSDEDLDALGYG
jgi:predicted Zn-dependent protease with MMP-like domain